METEVLLKSHYGSFEIKEWIAQIRSRKMNFEYIFKDTFIWWYGWMTSMICEINDFFGWSLIKGTAAQLWYKLLCEIKVSGYRADLE